MSYNKVNVNVSGPKKDYTSTYKTYILRGNMSFADQVTEPNVKYVIKYNFDLDGGTVTIPEGCLLEFDGGSVSNGTIEFDNTILIYNQQEEDVLKNITKVGYYEVSAGGKGDKKDNINGMGKIYLKKNKGFAEQLIQDNTIYVIQYDFDLGEESVTIPANCVLEFDGGSLSNGVFLGGKMPSESVYTPEMFGADGVDDTQAIQNCLTLAKNVALCGDYKVNCTDLTINNSKVVLNVPSDTNIRIDGSVTLLGNEKDYGIFFIDGTKNITIEGRGKIVGNNFDHAVDSERAGNGINIYGGQDILIKDIEICNLFTDGIYIRKGIGTHSEQNAKKINIVGCNIHDVRRQGISATVGEYIIIDGCTISNVYGAQPGACIDIEREWEDYPLSHILIKNITGYNSVGGIFCNSPYAVEDVVLQNVSFYKGQNGACESKFNGSVICRNCNFGSLDLLAGNIINSSISLLSFEGTTICYVSGCTINSIMAASNTSGRVIFSNCSLVYNEDNADRGLTIYNTSTSAVLDFYKCNIFINGAYKYQNLGKINFYKCYYYNRKQGLTILESTIIDSVIETLNEVNDSFLRMSAVATADCKIINSLIKNNANTYPTNSIRNQSTTYTLYCQNLVMINSRADENYKTGTIKEVNTVIIGNEEGTLGAIGLPKIGNSTLVNRLAAGLTADDKGVQIYRTDQYGFGIWDGTKFCKPDGAAYNASKSGTASKRPAGSSIYVGYMYFDTSLSPARPIYASAISGDTVTWVDATGATV